MFQVRLARRRELSLSEHGPLCGSRSSGSRSRHAGSAEPADGPDNDPHLAPEVGFGRGFVERNEFADDLAESRRRIEVTLDEIKDTQILRTVVGGRTVYEK